MSESKHALQILLEILGKSDFHWYLRETSSPDPWILVWFVHLLWRCIELLFEYL